MKNQLLLPNAAGLALTGPPSVKLPLLLTALFIFFAQAPALAEDEIIPPKVTLEALGETVPGEATPEQPSEQTSDAPLLNTGLPFFDDANIGGAVYYFQRRRDRFNTDSGDWDKNLDHGTFQAEGHFESGYFGEKNSLQIGMDVGYYLSYDFWNNASIDHEMNFVPWANPWRMDWNEKNTVNGGEFYKANLKIQAGPEAQRFWLRAGYLQPQGPGTLGVNWSILPGAYQGLETGYTFGSLTPVPQADANVPAEQSRGKLELAAMVANAYRAPWYQDTYKLRTKDGKTDIDYVWTVGARYSKAFGTTPENTSALTLESAYGKAEGDMNNFHAKIGYALPVGEGNLNLKYHFYGMLDSADVDSPNANFDGLAYQHYLGAFYSQNLWNFRLEYTYSRVPQSNASHIGYFAYRLTKPTGSSKGAYDIWWDARSDWDHDQEMAVFGGVSRGLDDVLPFKGLTLGLGGAFGWDGEAYGTAQHLKEYAWTGDIIYVVPEGPLKGASVSFHYTRYYNQTDLPSWTGFQNAFQDEEDFKFLVCIPF